MAGSTLPSAPDDVRGRQMGNYEVLCRLTAGGMAEIFLASRRGLAGFHKPVVLKKILPDIQGQEEFVQMFLDEARVTAAFNHPNIAQVFDLDVAGDELFLAMEFVPGATLLEVARACLSAKEPMPAGFGLAAVRDTALALHYAHTFTDTLGEPSPVIHRDVAEKNIMVTYEGVTKLLDFGIAKSLAEVSRTQVGMVKGTSGYMSPEQILGQPLDARSDLFSLGVVLHECLTGARLFPGKAPSAVVNAVLRGPIPEPSRTNKAIPPELDAIVLKALSRRREERYATTLEFARELERAVSGLIWLPEQSGELLRRLFAERREQTRQLLAGARTATSEMKLPASSPETRDAAAPAPAPRLPTVTATPPQASHGPSSANTDIVPYSPLAKPPAAPAPSEPRPAPAPTRATARPSMERNPERNRPALPPPPRPRPPPRAEVSADSEEEDSEPDLKTAIVRSPRRPTTTTTPESSASPPEAPSSRSLPTRPIRTAVPDVPRAVEPGDETTRPNRRLPPAPLPVEAQDEEESDYPTLPYQTLPSPSAARARPVQDEEEDVLMSSGTHSIPAPSAGWGPRVALVLMLALTIVGLMVVLRWDAGLVSSWLMPSRASTAPAAPAAPAPLQARVPLPNAGMTPPAAPAPAPAAPPPESTPEPEAATAETATAETAPAPERVAPAQGAPSSASTEPSRSTPPRSRKTPGEATEPAATAAPQEEGTLTLRTNQYAQVFLGNRSLGETPLFKVRLPAGRHTLRLIGPDKKPRSLQVEIKANEDSSVSAEFSPPRRE